MGFKKKAKVHQLKFKDVELVGLEVNVRSMNTGQFFKLIKQSSGATDQQKLESTNALVRDFAKALVSWNLEDDNGKAVPTTLAGVESQDFDFLVVLLNAWIDAVSGVDESLEKKSNSGNQFPAVSIPMETL